MPTYVYEAVRAGGPARRYEIRHGISEKPLTRHPETGEPIRRVIAAGASILTTSRTSIPAAKPSGGGCCRGACGCAH